MPSLCLAECEICVSSDYCVNVSETADRELELDQRCYIYLGEIYITSLSWTELL